MTKNTDKHNRMQQLAIMLKTHPHGLRKAEIARRLGVHRSTVGRYIDELSLSLQLWERDNLIGLENEREQESDLNFSVYEGSFLLSLIKLYQQEINIKNPHGSSAIRKLSDCFKNNYPVLSESFLKSAELLDVENGRSSKDFTENFTKISTAWINENSVKINYYHESTGESCVSVYEPHGFFTARNSDGESDLVVRGVCRRTGEVCPLKIVNFQAIEYPFSEVDFESGYASLFCPVSEFARLKRPDGRVLDMHELNIKESNHRIKNSLFMTSGLIDIAFAGVVDENLKFKIEKLQSRIDAIALIHDQLSNNGGINKIKIDCFLSEIVEQTLEIAADNPSEIKKRIKIDDIQLPPTKALPLGMIVSELIINSFKYAMKNEFSVLVLNLSLVNGIVTMRYSDGGEGFRPNHHKKSGGSDMIQNFCRQLNCHISQKNKNFILEFPV